MRLWLYALCVMFALSGCSEGCSHALDSKADPEWRESQLTVHRIGEACIVLFVKDGAGADIATIPCPEGK